jgi:hypothetical protein
MATLNDYLKMVQRFTRDQGQSFLNPQDLIDYVNRARREVAMRSQCIRVLTPVSGAITSASVVSSGSGYTAPTVTITAPDYPSGTGNNPNGAQATAAAITQSGTIAAVNINYGGSGYFQPQATITDATGTGASVSLTVPAVNAIYQGQEVYKFSDIDLSASPGVESVYMIKSVSIIYNNYRYSLPGYAFSVYQSTVRQYPFAYQYVPTFFSQYGQGVNGSLYLYPLPSQTYQIEYDCFCLPQDLITDQSEEAIPDPWTDSVAYMAAYLCYSELQNFNIAKFYLDSFDKFLQRYSDYARPGRMVNPYGRYILPFMLGALELLHHVGSALLC